MTTTLSFPLLKIMKNGIWQLLRAAGYNLNKIRVATPAKSSPVQPDGYANIPEAELSQHTFAPWLGKGEFKRIWAVPGF